MEGYPEPTAGALIVNKDGKIFLMKSPKWHGNYTIPGGHIELGESILDALAREVKEETNMDVCDAKQLLIQEMIFDGENFAKKKHFIFIDHVCRAKETNDIRLNEEATEYAWFTPEEALELPIDKYTRILIEEYIRKYPEGY